MPFSAKGKHYPLPNEDGQPGILGKELLEIEDYFNLDGMQLMGVFTDEKPAKGYTKTKAWYALAWVCLNRGGEVCSLSDVLAEYAPDDFDLVETENLTEGGETVSATE